MINADEIFKDIVQSISTIERPVYFFTGYWSDFAAQLQDRGQSKVLKSYPLIFLDSNFTKNQENEKIFEISPSFYIITQTKCNYDIQERLDNVYKPILQPILEDFIKAIKSNRQINGESYFANTQKNLYFLQSQSAEQNQIADIVDAIEIKFKSIKIKAWQLC